MLTRRVPRSKRNNPAPPPVKVGTRRIIWKCPRCGRQAHDYVSTRRFIGNDKFGTPKYSTPQLTREVNGVVRDVSWDMHCSTCKSARTGTRIEGRVTQTPCNARCLASTSGKCECSCGGRNHGKNYL